MPNEDSTKPLWRDAAGVFTAFIIVVAFVAIGFVAFFVQSILGLDGKFDPAWMAAMLSLASAAFGYLIGKRATSIKHGFDRPICSACPLRDVLEK